MLTFLLITSISIAWFALWLLWLAKFSTFTHSSIRAMSGKQVVFMMVLGGPILIVISFLYFLYGQLGR